MKISQELINQIRSEKDQWVIIPCSKDYRKLNKILKLPEIQEAYAEATKAYWAVRRWDIFKYFRGEYPEALKPLDGEEYIHPQQIESCDWDWQVIGRRPFFWRFVLSKACHWLSVPNLLVAKKLEPKTEWITLSSELHTSVVDLQGKRLFDLNYSAMDIPAAESIEMLIGNEDRVTDCDFHDDSDPYDYMNGTAQEAIAVGNLVDNLKANSEIDVEAVLIQFIERFEHRIEEGLYEDLSEQVTTNAALNQEINALQLLTLRSDLGEKAVPTKTYATAE